MEDGHRFRGEARAFDIEWVDQSLHDSAVDALRDAHRGVGLVDQVSFLVMRRRGVDAAFAFDRDFETRMRRSMPSAGRKE